MGAAGCVEPAGVTLQLALAHSDRAAWGSDVAGAQPRPPPNASPAAQKAPLAITLAFVAHSTARGDRPGRCGSQSGSPRCAYGRAVPVVAVAVAAPALARRPSTSAAIPGRFRSTPSLNATSSGQRLIGSQSGSDRACRRARPQLRLPAAAYSPSAPGVLYLARASTTRTASGRVSSWSSRTPARAGSRQPARLDPCRSGAPRPGAASRSRTETGGSQSANPVLPFGGP